jgi:nucleotide-binding universal stress UspA family protein
MYGKIIVATDGSSCGNRAVMAAADLAQKYGASLTVLHVLMHGSPPDALKHMAEVEHLVDAHPNASIAFESMPAMAMSSSRMAQGRIDYQVIEAIGRKVVERAVEAVKDAGLAKVEGTTADGEPAEQIIKLAREQGADLIVLGNRGLSNFKRILMGSISQKVAQLADCACLIVR